MNLDLEAGIKELIAAEEAKQNPRKPIADPGKYDEAKEAAIRDMAAKLGYYAENGPLFDPEGNYRCVDCCLRQEPKSCTHVSGKIDMQTGSCMIWMIGGQINQPVGQKLTQIESNYAERPQAKGFGCHRCGWYAKAKKPDAKGRPGWCGWWGAHVIPLACCFAESGKDLKVAPGE